MAWAIRQTLKSALGLGLTALAIVTQSPAAVRAADEQAEEPAAKQAQPEQHAGLWLGVQCVLLDETVRAQLEVKSGKGLLVRDVAPGSPADKAGVRRNDVLLAAGEKRLTAVADLQQAVNDSSANELKIDLLRSGKPHSVSVKPEPRPDLSWPGVSKLPPREREALRQWIDQMHRGDGQFPPMAMRFFHPGMLLPGVAGELQLPDDASVTIFRQGKQPAKITVEQGDKTWEVSEDKLSDLPEHLRPAVEAMLPMAPGRAIRMPMPDVEGSKQDPSAVSPEDALRDSVNRQLDELKQRLEALERINRRQLQGQPPVEP